MTVNDPAEQRKWIKQGSKFALTWLIKNGSRECLHHYDGGRFVIDLDKFDEFCKKNGVK